MCEHGAEAVCPSYRLHSNHLRNISFALATCFLSRCALCEQFSFFIHFSPFLFSNERVVYLVTHLEEDGRADPIAPIERAQSYRAGSGSTGVNPTALLSYRLHLNHLRNIFFFPSLNVVFLHAFATFFITSACVGYG